MASGAKFEILAQLGAGGMGEVFLARRVLRREPVRLVALKRLRPELSRDPSASLRFEREARTCSLLSHPNLVSLVEWGVDRTGPYLALEYVDGRTASALRRNAPDRGLPLDVVVGIALDVARGLAHAHAGVDGQPVIHRDVSLDNVLVSTTGVAKLGDFGIAKVLGENELTRTGDVSGKVGYVAPELFEGARASTAADVFAFGVSLYSLVCRVPPFMSDNDAGVMRATLTVTPPAPRSLRPDVPPALDALILGCLAKRPEQRPSMEDVVARLARLSPPEATLRAKIVAAVDDTPSHPVTRLPAVTAAAGVYVGARRRTRWVWSTLVAGCVVAGALVWGIRFQPTRAAPPNTAVLSAPVDAAAQPDVTAGPATGEEARPMEIAPSPDSATSTARAETLPTAALKTPRAVRQRSKKSPRTTQGRLNVKVGPWGYLFVDGKLIGATPQPPVSLERGRHSVLIVNSELGERRVYDVVIRAGEETRLSVMLGGRKPKGSKDKKDAAGK